MLENTNNDTVRNHEKEEEELRLKKTLAKTKYSLVDFARVCNSTGNYGQV